MIKETLKYPLGMQKTKFQYELCIASCFRLFHREASMLMDHINLLLICRDQFNIRVPLRP